MNTIDALLKPLDGYLISITRNTKNGWYELQVGFPVKWVYKSTKDVTCDLINENEIGVLVRIYPARDGIDVDNLVDFVKMVIDVNQKILDKEREFNERIKHMKEMLEEETRKFYEELDGIKERSFKVFDEENPVNNPGQDEEDSNDMAKATNKKGGKKNNNVGIFRKSGVSITEIDGVSESEINDGNNDR